MVPNASITTTSSEVMNYDHAICAETAIWFGASPNLGDDQMGSLARARL